MHSFPFHSSLLFLPFLMLGPTGWTPDSQISRPCEFRASSCFHSMSLRLLRPESCKLSRTSLRQLALSVEGIDLHLRHVGRLLQLPQLLRAVPEDHQSEDLGELPLQHAVHCFK